jgi:hypothetical protein
MVEKVSDGLPRFQRNNNVTGRTYVRVSSFFFQRISLVLLVFFLCAPASLDPVESLQTTDEIGSERELVSIRKKPYLIYPNDNTAMQVFWQLDSTLTCTIDWGTDTLYSTGSVENLEYGDDHQHTCTITDLIPSTHYYYRVTVGEEIYASSFYSAPARDSTAIKFLAYGDTRTFPGNHELVAAAMIDEYKDDPGYQSLIIGVGDLVTDGGSELNWDEEFFNPSYPSIREIFSSVPFHSAVGSHEEYGVLFQKYFPYPFYAGHYWSFDYGPAHFVVVDQYPLDTGQLQWIESDLALSSKPWKFIYLHEPGWSAGAHENNINVQTYIQPLCETYDVPIVFAGHNHYYARAVINGVNHVTSGGGGAPLHDPDPSYPGVVSTDKSYHYCKIEIDDHVLRFAAVRIDGTVIDTFTIDREPENIEGEDGAYPVFNSFALSQNYPNPFNPMTTIAFTIPDMSGDRQFVSLNIYDARGRHVKALLVGKLEPGNHSVVWNGLDDRGRVVASGIYLYTLRTGGEIYTRRMMILK